jgi:hypothetical protein
MEIGAVEITESPGRQGLVRLRCEVAYADHARPAEEYWFEVEAPCAGLLTTDGNAWIAGLAPLAATLGEPLRSSAPIDAALIDNVRELMRVWSAWYPELRVPSVEGPIRDSPASADRTAAFFSGGVDSFFTALRHAHGAGTPRTERIDDLIFVHGFDIAIENDNAVRTVRPALESAAARLGRRLVVVRTNLRATRFGTTGWARLSHGAALAAVGHALGRGYAKVLVPSSAGYRDLRPWGSHPLTDPLFTSSTLQVLHDGPAYMRVEKTAFIAQHDVALDTLRVCWRSKTGLNCGACNNCYRTMLALEVLGVLERCATFDRTALDMRRAGRIYCPESYDIRQFGYIRDLALAHGRDDIVAAIDRSLRGSRTLVKRISRIRRVRRPAVAGRFARRVEDKLLDGWLI